MKKKAKVIFYYSTGEKIFILLGKRVVSSSEEFWWLPGGSVEGGESLLQAVARELNEEISLTPALIKGFEKYNEFNHPPSITYPTDKSEVTVFMVQVNFMDETIECKEEFTEMKWFDLTSLPSDMSREFPNIQPYVTNNFFAVL